MRYLVGVSILTAIAACHELPADFTCQTDEQCDVGSGGRCEANGRCSVVDPACFAARRYQDDSGSQSDTCVAGFAVNFGGPAVSSAGVAYLSHTDALALGMMLADAVTWQWTSVNTPTSFTPPADAETVALLGDGIFNPNVTANGQGFSISKAGPNGSYDVSFHCIEDSQSNLRNEDIIIEGVMVAQGVCDLPLGRWEILGPYRVEVSDEQLDIRILRSTKGKPQVSAMNAVAVTGGP